jgi:hypothetical protein
MNRTLRVLALATAVGVACHSDLMGPIPTNGPGAVALRLTIPHAGEGALVIAVSGGPLDSVRAAGLDIAWLESAPNTYGVLLRGALQDGATLELWVPDRAQAAAYVATVTQAVRGDTYERWNVEGYAIAAP